MDVQIFNVENCISVCWLSGGKSEYMKKNNYQSNPTIAIHKRTAGDESESSVKKDVHKS